MHRLKILVTTPQRVKQYHNKTSTCQAISLQDQSLDLPSDQGVFISIAKHNGIIGYCVSNGSRIIVTRQNLAFDPHLYLFHQKPLSAPAWQTFHNLTQAAVQGSTQQVIPSTDQPEAQEYASSESDVDDSLRSKAQNLNDNAETQEQADKQDSSDSDAASDDDDDKSTGISSRQKRTPAAFKVRPESSNAQRKANVLKQYNSDKEYSDDRNSILDIAITKHFPGHGSFNGKIIEYHPASDNYSVTYQDGDSEIMSHSNVLKYIRGTKQYEDYHENQKTLYSAFCTAVSTTTSQSDNMPENYKDARATPDVADWMKACDVEMGKLRSLGCWEVLPRSSLPQNASVMKSRWTLRCKKNELVNLKSVSHRSRLVAKGYSQVQGLHYFENYAPVASFITLRSLFALTSIPNFQALQFDESVAFIQSKRDSNHPPVHC